MGINAVNGTNFAWEAAEKYTAAGNVNNLGGGCFADTLLRKSNAGLDSYTNSEKKTISDCGVHARTFQTRTHRYDAGSINAVETDRFSITGR